MPRFLQYLRSLFAHKPPAGPEVKGRILLPADVHRELYRAHVADLTRQVKERELRGRFDRESV